MARTARRALALAAAAAGATAGAARKPRRGSRFDVQDLTGRTAVVTGGGSGIGRSLALLVGARGATVHVADRDAAGAEAVAAQVRAAGGTAHAHTVDVTDAAAVARLADDVFAVGPVDLLFNNAGIGHAGAVVDTTLEDWRRLFDVNVLGVVHGLHAFLPRLVAQGTPVHVVNTASMAGLVPNPGMAAYSATKAAVVALTDALDIELRDTAVSATALCPGVIDTAIVRTSTMRGAYADAQGRAVALYARRGTSPDVVARQALEGMTRPGTVIASPRYQVVPHWVLKRVAPRAARTLSIVGMKVLTRG